MTYEEMEPPKRGRLAWVREVGGPSARSRRMQKAPKATWQGVVDAPEGQAGSLGLSDEMCAAPLGASRDQPRILGTLWLLFAGEAKMGDGMVLTGPSAGSGDDWMCSRGKAHGQRVLV